MTIISTSDINEARKQILLQNKENKRPIVVEARNDEFNRKMLEFGRFDIILGIEKGERKDTLKNVNSGLNSVLANIASKNRISIGIDLKEIKSLKKKEKALRLSKIIQNIKVCRKAKTKIALLNYSNKKDALSFMMSLGAPTQQAKESIE